MLRDRIVNGRFVSRLGVGLACAFALPTACRSYVSSDESPGESGAGGQAQPTAGTPNETAGGEANGAMGQGGQDSGAAPSGVAGTEAVTGGTDAGLSDAGAGAGGRSGAGGGEESGGVGDVAGAASSAGAAGAEQGPTLVLPSEIDDLVLWLEASTCSVDAASRVTSCPDQSDQGNVASQSTDAPPLLIEDALGGHAVLSFDGDGDTTNVLPTTLVVQDSESLQLGNGQFTAIIVGRWRNPHIPQGTVQGTYSGYGAFLNKVEPNYPYRGISILASYPGALVTSPAFRRFAMQLQIGDARVLSNSTNLNDDQYRVHTARRVNEDRIELRISGASEGFAIIAPEVSVSAVGEPLFIGGQRGAPLRGEIAELLLVRGALSDETLLGLELGLMKKYGL
jgi:hypothetical protein